MRKARLSLIFLAGAAVLSPAALAENLTGTSVVLRTLDKVTATTKDFTVKIGDELEYGSLTVAVKHCEKRPPEEIPESYAFLQIKDARLDGKGEAAEENPVIFSGWMLSSNPAISPLDHGVYDVWVLRCNAPERTLPKSPELRP
jgi:hypothetical protein